MKAEKKILTAFILNLAFSLFEMIGGIYTGSVAIVSDAVHDTGDALSIGASYLLEKKSRKQPDEIYTYGYGRFSLLGSLITVVILVCSSLLVIYNAVGRIFEPKEIRYNGMILLALIGVCVNFCAALFTRDGESLNEKAVNLHMLEDVLGWAVVLVGAVVMKFTDFVLIDPLMSVGAAFFILVNAMKTLKEILDIFLEKIPCGICIDEIKEHILAIDGVTDVHHIHIRSIDGMRNTASMHIVTDSDFRFVKEKVKEELRENGICHVILEPESPDEVCHEKNCRLSEAAPHSHHHHHH